MSEQGVGAFGDVPERSPALGRLSVQRRRLGQIAGVLSEVCAAGNKGVLLQRRVWLQRVRNPDAEIRLR